MTDLNNSWQNNKQVFDLQLKLNLDQLSHKNNYPVHWKDFLNLLENTNIYTLLDIGCGCGAYYKLLKTNYSYIQYTGIDYSDDAISIAKSTWKYNNFFIKDFWSIDSDFISNYDAVHLGAVLDMMTNGDEAMEFLLTLKPRKIILSRMEFTKKDSYHEKYLAYGTTPTSKYYHNIESFSKICEKYNYKINYYNTVLLLSHNN